MTRAGQEQKFGLLATFSSRVAQDLRDQLPFTGERRETPFFDLRRQRKPSCCPPDALPSSA